MIYNQYITRLFKLLLLVLFIGYYSGISLFGHIHIVGGHVIVHSHFYKTTADSSNSATNHSHQESDFELIQSFNKVSYDDIVINCVYQKPLSVLLSIFVCSPSIEQYTVTLYSIPARAPPAC